MTRSACSAAGGWDCATGMSGCSLSVGMVSVAVVAVWSLRNSDVSHSVVFAYVVSVLIVLVVPFAKAAGCDAVSTVVNDY